MLQKINYEEWGKIRYRNDYALFADGPGRFPVTFFHLGLFFQKAVRMHVVDGGESRQIVYDQSYFDMPADFAGATICRRARASPACASKRRATERSTGARTTGSPFSAPPISASIGELAQYGLSARGVAIDVAVADRPEEFPDFTDFYIEPGGWRHDHSLRADGRSLHRRRLRS